MSSRRSPVPGNPLRVAAFVVSIDTELAWGVHDDGRDAIEALGPTRAHDEREVVAGLLEMFQRHAVPATWAFVGHLLLESCQVVEGRPHPDLIRPDYEWHDGDWFRLDPGSSVKTDPMWYAPDMFEMVRGATPRHEVGCHTFSHILAGDPGCSARAFASDLMACSEAAAARGIVLRSFVFARNSVGHLEVLADAGYLSYRGHRPRPFPHLKGPSGAMARLVDRISPREGSAVFPEPAGAMWNIPATNFYGPWRRPRWMPHSIWISRQIRRLELAARTRSLYHLWFHPEDLLRDTGTAFAGLDRILERVVALRDRGEIETVTMGGLAENLQAASATGD
ncbi:MAG TPA: hypothetical protein VK960_03190 [Acidimicrobiia bacterium]|nr:hypothetical protein [Acidimicrobiia bacterium]